MAKSPHTAEFRANVAQEYLDGCGSYAHLTMKYSVGKTTIQQWVDKYRLYGIAAFIKQTGNSNYSAEFKTTLGATVAIGEVLDIIGNYRDDELGMLKDYDPYQYIQDVIAMIDWINRFENDINPVIAFHIPEFGMAKCLGSPKSV